MSAARLDAVTVLLVDDSRPVRTVLKTLLAGLGVSRIFEASDAEEAMIACRAGRPDLAIIDHDLGRLSGVALAARLRDPAAGLMAGLPLVLLSPTGETWRTAGAAEAGVDAVLPKPVTAATLGRTLTRLAVCAPRPAMTAPAAAAPAARPAGRAAPRLSGPGLAELFALARGA